MRITPVPHGLDKLGQSPAGRTPGLHMSDIYGDLYSDLEPKRYVRGSPLDPVRLEAGLAWEDILEKAVADHLAERPGEITSEEGIICSPDLIIYSETIRVGEIKLTWLSCSEMPMEEVANGRFPPKFDKYMTQMKAYCHVLDTPYARLLGFFVNGGYEFLRKANKGKRLPPTPQMLAWDIEFTKRELDDEWAVLMRHARNKRML